MGGPLAPPHDVGKSVGGCQLIRRLDEQDASSAASSDARAVYLARQPRLGNRLVVVKLMSLLPIGMEPGPQAAEQTDYTAGQLLQHVRMLARLTHPNIVALYDAGLAGNDFYLVTQYAPDGSLADALRGAPGSRWTLDLPAHPRFVVDLISQVAAALQHMHDHGVAHGAVRPASVLLHRQPDGRWHALLAEPRATLDVGDEAGEPHLLRDNPAPANEGRCIDAADDQDDQDDQYALAALALLLLAGRAPTQSERAHTGGSTAPLVAEPHTPVTAMPSAVERVLARAHASSPAARFPSVADFAEALRLACGFEARPLTVPRAPGIASQPIMPVPRQLWLEPERALPEPPRGLRRVARGTPRTETPAAPRTSPRGGHRHWRRGVVGVVGIALLIGALVLAIRLPDMGARPRAANGQPDAPSRQGVGIAGGQIAIARGAAATATASMAAAAPPPTPPGPSDWATLVSPPGTITVAPGQRVNVSFVLRNSGVSIWSAAGGYGLTCDLAHHPTSQCSPGLWIGFGQYVISPGEEATFTIDIAAPTDPGSYALWLNLAHAGRAFTSPDVPLLVVVQVPPQSTTTPSATPTSTPSPSPTASPTDTPTDTPTPSPASTPQGTPPVEPTPLPTLPTTMPPESPPALATPFLALGGSA